MIRGSPNRPRRKRRLLPKLLLPPKIVTVSEFLSNSFRNSKDFLKVIALPVGNAYHSQQSMELALNLIWLCLAIVGIAILVCNLSRAPERGSREPSNGQKIVAMTCALIILFFVVSMTDDLHDQEVAVEESRLLRITGAHGSTWFSTGHSVSSSVPALFLAAIPFLAITALPSTRRQQDALKACAAAVFSKEICGRAPPAPLA